MTRSQGRVLRSVIVQAMLALAVVVLATCGLDQLVSSSGLVSVSLSTDTVIVVGGASTLAPLTSDGSVLTGVLVTWTSSDSLVARVTPSGVVTGVGEGAAVITATLSAPELPPAGVPTSRTVVVNYAGLAIDPMDSLTGIGQTVTPVVRGLDAAGKGTAAVSAVLTSSDPTVAMAATPTVIAVKNGTVTIHAAYRGLAAQATIKVRQVAERITFGVNPFVFRSLGRDTTVTLLVFDTRDSLMAAAPAWSSADATVASVTASGVMRALQVGATTVRASVDTVTAGLPVSVSQAMSTLSKTAGDGQTQTAGAPVVTRPAVAVLDAGGFPVAGVSVTFSVTGGGGSVTGAVQVSDANGRAAVTSWTLGGVAGSNALKATAGAWTASFSATGVAGSPAKLVIQGTPANGSAAGAVLAPALVVAIRDANDNAASGATTAVTVALGTNPHGAALGGTLTVNAVGGVATFDDLTVSVPGTGYTLTAAAASLTGATSAAIDLIGPATKLAFAVAPSTVTAGAVIAPAVQVSLLDAANQVVPSAANPVALTIGANPGGGSLTGGGAVTPASGVATFSALSLDKVGVGYTVNASAAGLSGATSAAFNVSVGAASKLTFTAQPSNTDVGAVVSPAVQVTVQDAQGNPVTSSTAPVTVSFFANPGSATLGGTLTQAAVSGVATFGNLTVSAAATGYRLSATSGGLAAGTSGTFTITNPVVASKLAFVQQPTAATAGVSVAPAVTVAVQNASGVTLTADNSTVVTLALASGPAAGTLKGTLTATASSGIATFATLSDTVAGSYTIQATSGALTAATSSAYTISAAGAAQLIYLQQPTSQTAGVLFSPVVRVAVADAFGNTVPSATNAITVGTTAACCVDASAGLRFPGGIGTPLGGAVTVAAVSGVATFSTLRPRYSAEVSALQASASGFTTVGSSVLTVSPAPAAKVWVTAGSTQTANFPFLASAYVLDSLNNQVNAGSQTISLAIGTNPGGGALQGGSGTPAVGGRADFPSTNIDAGGNGYTLVGSTGGLSSLASDPINVAAFGTASRIRFKTQPANATHLVAISPAVVVCVEDANSNIVTSATDNITLTLSGGAGGAVLGGTVTVGVVNGCATFSNLTVSLASGTQYKLNASASVTGFAQQSNGFVIN